MSKRKPPDGPKSLDSSDGAPQEALDRVALGERLVLLRRRTGLHQHEAASLLGVARLTLGNWEIGSAAPKPLQVQALADFYVVSLDVLLGRAEMPPPVMPPPAPRPRGPGAK